MACNTCSEIIESDKEAAFGEGTITRVGLFIAGRIGIEIWP